MIKLQKGKSYKLTYKDSYNNISTESNCIYVDKFKDDNYGYYCQCCDKPLKSYYQFNIPYKHNGYEDYESRFFGSCCMKNIEIKEEN